MNQRFLFGKVLFFSPKAPQIHFHKSYRQQAEDRVKTQLTLEAITKAEGIEPTDEEIDKELSRFAEQGKKTLEEFKKDMPEGDLEYFKEVASINKTVKFLKDNAGKE